MRIISLAPSNTELLFALGLGDQVIAITNLCDYPQATKDKTRIGSWITTDTEKLKELKPDFIFTSYFIPPILRGWKGPSKLIHVEPKTLSDVYKSILIIGKEVKRHKAAENLVKKMQQEFEKIKNDALKLWGSGTLQLPRVYMEEWPVPPMASGNWVPELVKIAGGISGIAQKGKPSSEFKLDRLISFDPDVIIFHWCGFGKRFNKELIIKRKGWKELRAVKNNLLFNIDDSLINRPGPRLIQGAREIQKILSSSETNYFFSSST